MADAAPATPGALPVALVTAPRIPEPLRAEGLQTLWASARKRLDRFGPDRRGEITRPNLGPSDELALQSLLGHPLSGRLDLAEIEAALAGRGIGEDLCGALTRLGHPPSADAAQRRAAKRRATEARDALRLAVSDWPESWAVRWTEKIAGSGLLGGLGSDEVGRLAADVRCLLDRLEDGLVSTSRTELAAALFGSSHALDKGEKLGSFVRWALRCRLGSELDGRELWEASGIQPDRVSMPALTWAIPLAGDSPVDLAVRSATSGGLPLHISLLALLRHPLRVPTGTSVLVVENPRLVEAAAERGLGCCVVAANGNPTTTVTTLTQQLLESGARVGYHGDFDAAGIAICRRMHELGCLPWRMDGRDYQKAVEKAERDGVRLDRDLRGCGPTPWDSALEDLFEAHRLIVHEEFVLAEVLDEAAQAAW